MHVTTVLHHNGLDTYPGLQAIITWAGTDLQSLPISRFPPSMFTSSKLSLVSLDDQEIEIKSYLYRLPDPTARRFTDVKAGSVENELRDARYEKLVVICKVVDVGVYPARLV